MEFDIVVPHSKLVAIDGVKLNVRCLKCGRTFGKTLFSKDGTTFHVGAGFEVCTTCMSEMLNAQEVHNEE
jgi:hypothetical protein